MFERFTERSRQVLVFAETEAHRLKHNYIGTEHVLLGLLCEAEGLAAQVLQAHDVTLERVRTRVEEIIGIGTEVMEGRTPFTPRAKKSLELALREALSMGHNYIGTEHLLLGLLRGAEGVGARVLNDLKVDAEVIRDDIITALTRPAAPIKSVAIKNLQDELAEVRVRKSEAIEKGDFDGAADCRDEERRLLAEIEDLDFTSSAQADTISALTAEIKATKNKKSKALEQLDFETAIELHTRERKLMALRRELKK
jgi:ATP-dependent Clp protease ATP-binding subunit ClpA